MSDHFISTPNTLTIKKSFSPHMIHEPTIFASPILTEPLFLEHTNSKILSSFTQIANVSSLSSVIKVVGLPDIHCGYGFPIGCVAGFDYNNPECIISPGGVGYDINCGVRCVSTNLVLSDLENNNEIKQLVADLLEQNIHSGIGSKDYTTNLDDDSPNSFMKIFKGNSINEVLDHGLDYLTDLNLINHNEKYLVEDKGRMDGNSTLIGQKATARGLNQLASLGSGNHYLEIQVVDQIYDNDKANVMGISKKDQIIFMIHTGSRGVGHQTCHDFLMKMNSSESNFIDKQLAYANIHSDVGKDYIKAMGSCSNFGFCNRALIDKITRNCIRKVLPHTEFNLVYDVCHNIAKRERHTIDNVMYDLIVHRKGASRAFGPNHEMIPDKYKFIGQPVIIGGSMGTASYILAGTDTAMKKTMGSSCHGAGRVLSRTMSQKQFNVSDINKDLDIKNILVKCGSERGLVEEAPNSYKDVDEVVNVCEATGISEKIVRVKPVIVIKG